MIFSTDFLLVHGREPVLYPKERSVPRMEKRRCTTCPAASKYIVAFSNLSVSIAGKKLLSSVNGIAKPGQLLAIMGPSGSGKTTLLNALSGRTPLDNQSSLQIAGLPLDKRHRRRIGYVTQHDVFFADLTLRQTLKYTSELRLPDFFTDEERKLNVDRIVQVLELEKCLDTAMGGGMKRGLSGGERKRASIACELLTDPPVMLLDEPTSGLDSTAALGLIRCLKEYAKHEQKTVILSIHQPSSQIFHLFDKLLLLHGGQSVYFGPAKEIVEHFSLVGLPIQVHYNPADVIMDYLKGSSEASDRLLRYWKSSKGVGESKEKEFKFDSTDPGIPLLSTQTSETWSFVPPLQTPEKPSLWCSDNSTCFCDNVQQNEINVLVESEALPIKCSEEGDSGRSSWSDSQSHGDNSSNCHSHSSLLTSYDNKWPTSFWTQFKVLTRRNFLEAKPRMLSKLNWIQTIGLGLMAGFLWLQLERKEETISDIQGWMFFSTTYWMLFALFGALASFPGEQEVVNKERISGAYRLSAYYSAKMVGELPLVMTMPALYYFISYPMMGFHNVSTFLLLLCYLLLNSIVAQSAGLFIGALCMDFQASTTVSALYTLAMQLFGGFLATKVPPWLQWARSLSMIHYAFQSMQMVEFSGGPLIRCASENSRFSSCNQKENGTIPYHLIIEASGNPILPLEVNTVILFLFLLIFRVLGYIVLRYYRTPR
ncbi:uncharacterized protein LOC136028656 isoform X2 [Artemia franciscana]|uniref:ABC transporter domain-containing protein n=2 Tax=Artemia franciscana TaxID=6661 RepID=A0AA88IUF8_ARTSF|nr:hypothetical protein QYM36_008159 [Artemia franciscana]